MADIAAIVYRPVAFPQKFLGAPVLPSATAFICCSLLMMAFFAFKNYALWGVLALLLWPFLHAALMYSGYKEPHLSTLMQTYHLTSVKARNIGRAARQRRVFNAG